MHYQLRDQTNSGDREGIRRRPGPRFQMRPHLGISTDEAQRSTDTRQSWIINDCPLGYEGWRRFDCAPLFAEEYPGHNLSGLALLGWPYRRAEDWVAVWSDLCTWMANSRPGPDEADPLSPLANLRRPATSPGEGASRSHCPMIVAEDVWPGSRRLSLRRLQTGHRRGNGCNQ